MNDEYVENMAVLLQSLDVDGDAYNGIVITEEMRDAFSDDNFDLATISEEDLRIIIEETGRSAVTEDDAMTHVQDMLVEYTDLEVSDLEVRIDENLVETTSDLLSGIGFDFSLFDTVASAEYITETEVSLRIEDLLNIEEEQEDPIEIEQDTEVFGDLVSGWVAENTVNITTVIHQGTLDDQNIFGLENSVQDNVL